MRTIFRNIIRILEMHFLLISFNQTTTFQLTLQMDTLYQEMYWVVLTVSCSVALPTEEIPVG